MSDCTQVISTLFDAFSSFIVTDFNLNLQKFVKSHFVYEFDSKQIIFLEKKFKSLTNDALQCIWLYIFFEYNLNQNI